MAIETKKYSIIEKYKRNIESLALNKESMVFLNSGKEHASIVMGNIFNSSKDIVRVFAGSFNGDVSGDSYYRNHLIKFLENGGKLKVLLEQYNDENPPAIFSYLNSFDFFYPENVEVKISNTRLVSDSDNEKAVHFTTGDSSMYRIEYDTINYLAKGNFNDPLETNNLIEIFDEIFDESKVHIL